MMGLISQAMASEPMSSTERHRSPAHRCVRDGSRQTGARIDLLGFRRNLRPKQAEAKRTPHIEHANQRVESHGAEGMGHPYRPLLQYYSRRLAKGGQPISNLNLMLSNPVEKMMPSAGRPEAGDEGVESACFKGWHACEIEPIQRFDRSARNHGDPPVFAAPMVQENRVTARPAKAITSVQKAHQALRRLIH